MDHVTIVWAGAAGAALLLASSQALAWLGDRRSWYSLALVFAALGLVGIAYGELGMMHARSPEEWGRWVRWIHVPLYVHLIADLLFLRLYFGTGRMWLFWTIFAMRSFIVVENFLSGPNFNFDSIEAIRSLQFLGESVTTLAVAVPSDLQWLATLSNVLILVFFADATRSLWRRGTTEGRRRALVIGAGSFLFLSISTLSTQVVIWGLADLPMLITPPYVFVVFAMFLELGRDSHSAAALSRQLQESEYRLELAANAAHLGLWSWESRSGHTWATARSRELFGLGAEEELSVERLQNLVHEHDLPRLRNLLRDPLEGPTRFSHEFRVRQPKGGPRWLAVSGRLERDVAGRPTLLRGVVRDISERKQAAQEAEELRREVRHTGRVTMLGRLVSSLAHELGQPLSAILRNVEAAELLMAEASPNLEELRAIISDIHKDDRRAGDIIDKLRTLLKRREVQVQPLSVDSLVRDAGILVRADAAARHVALEYALLESLPLVSGDRVHLSQVLINLLQNGIDASCQSGEAGRRVTIAAQQPEPGTVEISVTDSGPGIHVEALTRVFDPFYTTKADGMGMGLSISRMIVEAHGGRIWAENQGNGGAVFRLRLPAVAA